MHIIYIYSKAKVTNEIYCTFIKFYKWLLNTISGIIWHTVTTVTTSRKINASPKWAYNTRMDNEWIEFTRQKVSINQERGENVWGWWFTVMVSKLKL